MQVRCLREALPAGVEVGTVDKFQGREAPVVFFSMASSTGEDVPRGLEFLFSRNRFNVAISRARALAVVVCSPALLDVRCRTVEQMQLVNATVWVRRELAFFYFSLPVEAGSHIPPTQGGPADAGAGARAWLPAASVTCRNGTKSASEHQAEPRNVGGGAGDLQNRRQMAVPVVTPARCGQSRATKGLRPSDWKASGPGPKARSANAG